MKAVDVYIGNEKPFIPSKDKINDKILPLITERNGNTNREITEVINELAVEKDKKWQLKTFRYDHKQETLKGISLPSIDFDKTKREQEHSETIYILYHLGKSMGFDVFIGKNEQRFEFEGERFANMSIRLPDYILANEKAKKTIEQIDVMWFKNNSPIAAFEVEYSTGVITGIDRFLTLTKVIPLSIKLFIIAKESDEKMVRERLSKEGYTGPPLEMEKKWTYILRNSLIDLYKNIQKTKYKIQFQTILDISKSIQ
jgi:type II restriction enzyme